MSFFDGEACPDDNLKGILSIHLKLGNYLRDACMGELPAPPAPHFVFLITL